MAATSYVTFSEIPVERRTRAWVVRSTSETHLGSVEFYPRWRCYTFHPGPDTIFNAGCLRDIAAFCEQQTKEWREGLKLR